MKLIDTIEDLYYKIPGEIKAQVVFGVCLLSAIGVFGFVVKNSPIDNPDYLNSFDNALSIHSYDGDKDGLRETYLSYCINGGKERECYDVPLTYENLEKLREE
ncbi:MAG: hypothetical protein ABIG93_03825 [archaeon]|nr:hypothetical protein [Nanoarchaeota archaeon]